MNRCAITYTPCDGPYSQQGLRKLSPQLKMLRPLPYSAEEQIREAAARAHKMSIQGVQPKLSARLNVAQSSFEIVDQFGQYILKPQNPQYAFLPENEDVAMRQAAAAGVEVPLHGLLYSQDGMLTYFIRRFDRVGHNKKLAVEDFGQLLGLNRETKYNASMEKIAAVINKFCTFPAIEKIKLFRLTLVNFLLGNEDMHVKNFSLITHSNKVEFSPAYDILNTALTIDKPIEEIALPVMGKKSKLDKTVLIDYFAHKRLSLNDATIDKVCTEIRSALPAWDQLISDSFLPPEMQQRYREIVHARSYRLLGVN